MNAVGRGPGTWTWSKSWWLEVKAMGWMLGVTLPAATILVMAVFSLVSLSYDSGVGGEAWYVVFGQAVFAVLLIDMVAAPFTFAAVLVSLPFTYVLGRALGSVRDRRLLIASTSALAGMLAAVPAAFAADLAPFFIPLSVAAGAAAALARWGELRRDDRLATTGAVDRAAFASTAYGTATTAPAPEGPHLER